MTERTDAFSANEVAHRFDDVDKTRKSHHHTIGDGENQSASGALLKTTREEAEALTVRVTDVENRVTALETDGAWTDFTFAGAWVNFGGTTQTCQHRLLPNGDVQLRGSCKDGAVGTITTLPVGKRPLADLHFNVRSTGGGLALIRITSAGVLEVQSYVAPGANTFVSLSEIPQFSTVT